MQVVERIGIVDSHTGGEPTRIIVSGGPTMPARSMAGKLDWFRQEYDCLRRAVVTEPRGSEIIVGAVMCEASEPGCAAGIIFFNNVGYLGMCVHGTIGLMVTLGHIGRLGPGEYRVDTPVGIVTATLHNENEVSVANVASHRTQKNVRVDVPGHGVIHGDVAWGGNWFFLVHDHPMELALANADALTEFTWAIRKALAQNGIAGSDGHEIDHVELYAPSKIAGVNSKNFVLCPGKAYDRSPCGTGTSAKLACLYEDGKLKAGEIWRQESITGSVFEGSVRIEGGRIVPTLKGSAFVTGETDMIFDSRDPFRFGITA
ncbi:MAG TPA: proline racemase family protein [Candidatus Limnocylindrales bacterium]|nr:proline racemase family protein [Candidatus Limnocylindrales bacterium]